MPDRVLGLGLGLGPRPGPGQVLRRPTITTTTAKERQSERERDSDAGTQGDRYLSQCTSTRRQFYCGCLGCLRFGVGPPTFDRRTQPPDAISA